MTIDATRAEGAPEMASGGRSAVSWAAILAGAAAAAATTLILLALGSGIGFAASSPWAKAGATALKLSVGAVIWLIVTQWIASGVGGYLTGRLRTRWIGVHTHEVFFRDTAHGFLAWAIATVFAAGVLSSAAVHTAVGSARLAAPAGGMSVFGASPWDRAAAPLDYDVDYLFRSPQPPEGAATGDAPMQASRILEKGLRAGGLPTDDAAYLVQLVVAQTGISAAEAEQRVITVVTREQAAVVVAQQRADSARKAAASLSIFTALAMLVGALIASVAAALGGQQRDEHL